MTPAEQVRPQLAELQIADPPQRWQALGFALEEGGGRIATQSLPREP